MWDNSVVYPRTNTSLLLAGAVAGGKCLDVGANTRFSRCVNSGVSHGQAAVSDDGFASSFQSERTGNPKLPAEEDRQRTGCEETRGGTDAILDFRVSFPGAEG